VVGLKSPNFDFSKDALVTYEASKFNRVQWEVICENLNLDCPSQDPLKQDIGYFGSWSVNEYMFYYKEKTEYNLFPSLNAGALMLNNSLSNIFGHVLGSASAKYNKYILETEGVNVDYVSQDIYGICLDNITKNWSPFEHGFNFFLSDHFPEITDYYSSVYDGEISMVHYIFLNDGNRYSDVIKEYYTKVIEKYKI
jgi:hypothetical protein